VSTLPTCCLQTIATTAARVALSSRAPAKNSASFDPDQCTDRDVASIGERP
jgi:hypothetical protein